MALDERTVLKSFIGLVILMVLLGGLMYTFTLYRDSQKRISELTSQLEAGNQGPIADKTMIEKVARHFVLPQEEPKLVTIRDSEALRQDQPFFQQAQDGDVLLVYSTKVILYSPGLDRIIEVAQIRPDTVDPIPLISPSTAVEQ